MTGLESDYLLTHTHTHMLTHARAQIHKVE